jgi:hypothetical protein
MNISTLSYYLRLVSSHGIFLCPSPTVIHSVPPPSLSSVPILELNCFVRGDDASQVFSIEIANNNLVSALRDAIKDNANKKELSEEKELSSGKKLLVGILSRIVCDPPPGECEYVVEFGFYVILLFVLRQSHR